MFKHLEQRQMTYLDYCLSTQLCRKEEAILHRCKNVEIVDGRNLPLLLNTDVQNSKPLKESKIRHLESKVRSWQTLYPHHSSFLSALSETTLH